MPESPIGGSWRVELEAARAGLLELQFICEQALLRRRWLLTVMGRCAAGLGTKAAGDAGSIHVGQPSLFEKGRIRTNHRQAVTGAARQAPMRPRGTLGSNRAPQERQPTDQRKDTRWRSIPGRGQAAVL
jgi:hypothetical protein